MPETSVVPVKTKIPETYAELKAQVRAEIELSRRRMEQEKLRGYWRVGFLINEHVKFRGGRAEYGEKVIERLGEDLEINKAVLGRASQFAKLLPQFGIFARGRELSEVVHSIEDTEIANAILKLIWTHVRLLLTVKDDEKRFDLTRNAADSGWTPEELARKVGALRRGLKGGSSGKKLLAELLEPKRGTLNRCRVFQEEGALALDRGFAKYLDLTDEESAGLKDGDIVSVDEDGVIEKDPAAKPTDLYMYRAKLKKVTDADTFWMKIYIGGREWVKEKLRLRGLDASELSTSAGRRAKRFVEAEFEKAAGITITTTKPDKWDRYLSDVFLEQKDGAEIFLNNLLLEKGFARRRDSFSLEDWE